MESKRKNILTILLIIVIVVIAGVIGYLGFELISGKVKEQASQTITDEFDKQIPTITEEEFIEEMQQEQPGQTGEEPGENGNNSQSGNVGYNNSSRYYGQSSYYTSGINIDGYWVVGTIRIPASGIRYSIFSQPSKTALERGVGMVYTSNGINQPGNTVLAGHNYRNSLFFSKNKYLVEGNPIYIKDATGVEIKYVVTGKFTTNSSDTSFYQRDTGGKRELTLSTCTDRGSKTGERLIVLAREE